MGAELLETEEAEEVVAEEVAAEAFISPGKNHGE